MINTIQSLLKNPQQFGVGKDMLVNLNGESSYRQIPYLDLIETKSNSLPDAVIEVNGRASLYIIAQENILTSNDYTHFAELNDILACRADSRYLGVVEPGILKIYPIGLFKHNHQAKPIETIALNTGESALHHFLMGNIKSSTKKDNVTADAAWLDNYLFDLLKLTAQSLRDIQELSDGQVLSLVGRALFARFIIDRQIINDHDLHSITKHIDNLKDLFTKPDSIADTFTWMDKTFNGNLLLLSNYVDDTKDYHKFFRDIGVVTSEKICNELTNIMQGSVNGQQQLNWGRIRFDHVPADMLGQVYEYFAHVYSNQEARETSVHYTPRHIAQILVDSAFDGLNISDKSRATVLDPSVGAGVFLVLSFKRLVQERWRVTNQRPERGAIREILNTQLTGLDINPESLKFAALSLYLTALELDPDTHPDPLDKLRFTDINNKVLFDVGGTQLKNTDTFGSLSESLSQQFNGKYDIVIGNPPWTKQGMNVEHFTKLVRRVALKNDVKEEVVNQLQVDSGIPDIPFVWRALEWAKPQGMIAYALHAQHLLFKQGKGAEMRSALLQCLEVTGIMNGSAMRQEKGVWQNIDAPFCLLVARNNKPTTDSAFHYLSPYAERSVNQLGQFRIDTQAAVIIKQKTAQNSPYLFKSLFRGSWLDHDVLLRLVNNINALMLKNYWDNLGLVHGRGFELGKNEASRKFYTAIDSLKQNKLLEKNNLSSDAVYQLNLDALPLFNYDKVFRAKEASLYKGPLVIARQSPKYERSHKGGLLVLDGVVFNRMFFGYSCANHTQSEELARYIQLLFYSSIFSFFCLMTSSQYGAERETLLKEDVDSFPVIPFEKLSQNQLSEMTILSQQLIDGKEPWFEIDNFIASLYNLNEADIQVITDTISIQLPYSNTRKFADSQPNPKVIESFVQELEFIVRPFANRVGLSFEVKYEKKLKIKDWQFIRVNFANEDSESQFLSQAFIAELANHFWASQIRVKLDNMGYEIQIGQLDQNRYWTKTRARILALDLINNELNKLCEIDESLH